MEDKLVRLLESLGLTKNEVEVYIDLLKNRASTAYSIANRIGQHRAGVYDALRRLQQVGFIVEIQDENRKLYQTKEYTAIEEYLKQKQTELKEIVPYLKDVSNVEMPQGAISVSYGMTRVRTIFSSIFSLKQEILIWVLPKNVDLILGEWFLKEINETIVKNEIPVKIIYSEYFEPIKEITKNSFTETRYIKEDTNIFTIVCSDSVFLVVLGNPVTVVEMKNMDIAEGFRSRFLTLWQKSHKVRKNSSN